MSQVVQSTCPGCKNVLRIPAGWINQAIRCKHCGMVLQAKGRPAAAPSATPRVAADATARGTPDWMTGPASPTPPPPTRPVIVAVPAAIPTAMPVAAPAEPFSSMAGAPPAPRRSRRSGGSWWKGAVLLVCVLGVAVAVSVVAAPQLSQLLNAPSSTAVVENGEGGKKDTPKSDLPKKDTAKSDLPKKDTTPSKGTESTPKSTGKDPGDTGPKETKPETPKATKPETPPKATRPEIKKPPVVDLPKPMGPFPRRALLVSVNSYLFFSPVHFGLPLPQARNPANLLQQLNRGLRFPLNQTLLVSDAAPRNASPTLKGVIQESIKDFLTSSRAQDRIMVFFVGHYVEMGDEVFLAPVEGDREDKATLLPLADIYKQMEACPARQKVLVLDVCRFNPTRGLERPGSGPMEVPEGKDDGSMGPKLDAMLQAPPAGVQVWSSCSPWERSFEYDNAYLQNGVFLEALHEVLGAGVQGTIQKPEEPIPVAALVDRVNTRMKQLLDPLSKKQTSRLTGKDAELALAYDPDAAPAAEPKVKLPAEAANAASPKQIEEILDVISLPSIKPGRTAMKIQAKSLPLFEAKTLAMYEMDKTETELRKAVKKAQKTIQDQISGKTLAEEYGKPGNADAFKNQLKDIQMRDLARVMAKLDEALEDLKTQDTKENRAEEKSKGWLATTDYIKARLQAQIAYLYEYQSALGAMRKDFPALNENQNGWRLAAVKNLQGDGTGKKLAKEAEKLFEKIIKEHPGTPWELLARRDRLTALGLEWQGTKIGGEQ